MSTPISPAGVVNSVLLLVLILLVLYLAFPRHR